MGQDLRAYLDAVKRRKPDELHVVSRPIDPAYEITALVVKLEKERRRRPILLFENVKGTKFPVLTNVHASRSRLALALNCAPDAMLTTYLHAMDEPIPPRVVGAAPAQDVVLTGADVDLYALPQIVHHEGDAGPYITSAIALGALAIGSIDEDERAIMGGLFGEPLELVRCRTSGVLVPAHAEMVLECEILPGKRTAEGPFGEFTGYSLGERQREVVKVKAITHRRDALFQDITVAHLDHLVLSTIPMEATLYRAVRAMVPSVRAVRVPAPFTCYVSIEQRLLGQAKNALMAVFGADLYMKRVVVVDHDVDVFDDRQVTWAIATRCQPDRDIVIVSHARGSDLDPSTREDGYPAKWGVDATAKPSLGAYTPRHAVPGDVWER